MTNLYGWASLGENGKAKGGKPGNQNGKELKIAPWYDFGQTHTIRFKSKSRGRKCAKMMKMLCQSNKIGYAMDTRFMLYDVCKKYDWNWKIIEKMIKNETFPLVNTDCSSLVSVAVNLSYGKIKLGRYTTTGSIIEDCRRMDKHFIILETGHPKKTHKGDMEVKKFKHVIMNV